MAGLTIRKIPQKEGNRIKVFNPTTGQKRLLNPDTGKYEPWPTLGIVIEEYLPLAGISDKMVDRLIAEDFVTRVNEKPVTITCGPKKNPHSKTLTFVQCDQIIFHTLEGDLIYRVVKQPGKHTLKDDGYEIIHDYHMELEKAPDLPKDRLINPVLTRLRNKAVVTAVPKLTPKVARKPV